MWWGECILKGRHAWQVAGAWDMHSRMACGGGGGMHAEGGGMHGRVGVCMRGGVHGRGSLLEFILVY